MERKLPSAYYWFNKLNTTRFVPWSIDGEETRYETLNKLFREEHNEEREVQVFGSRQDMDTYCGFEEVNGEIQENIIVFHPSWQGGSKSKNIIQAEYNDIFDF
ncbi:MAG: hypothetical protein NXI10_16575, partial [bacterium]|nr:hypothetical protein [bacterium]